MKTCTLWVKLWNLNEQEDSTFFGPQQGQQTMNLSGGQSLLLFPSLVCKSSFNMKEWLSHVFTTAGLGQLNLFSSTLGMVRPGIKMIQTEYRLASVGVSVGPAYFLSKTCKSKVEACMSGVKGTPKGTQKRKWSPIWNWWPLFIWTWIAAYRFWGVPYQLCRCHELHQSSTQLLTTLFIQ